MTLKSQNVTSYGWNYQQAIEVAKEEGFKVYHHSPTLLLLDLDNAESCTQYKSMLPIYEQKLELIELTSWTSRSGIGKHVLLACKPLPFLERLIIQATLGSDPKREGLALMIYQQTTKEVSFLFKPQ